MCFLKRQEKQMNVTDPVTAAEGQWAYERESARDILKTIIPWVIHGSEYSLQKQEQQQETHLKTSFTNVIFIPNILEFGVLI